MTFHILGMSSSSQLAFIFFRGVGIPPTRNEIVFFDEAMGKLSITI